MPDLETTASALELVLCFEAWDQLGSAQGLDADRRRVVATRAVRALLATPA